MAPPVRRIGMPLELVGIEPDVYADPSVELPELWLPRGRWRPASGVAMHTFTDDFRQEFFWRRPSEGAIVALASGVVTAPDFSVYSDDPPQWAAYQGWRSALVATFWQGMGCLVLPVVSFGSGVERYVRRGSMWAVRGPGRGGDMTLYREGLAAWEKRARPGALVVFGRPLPAEVRVRCAVVCRPLVSSGRSATAQIEGAR